MCYSLSLSHSRTEGKMQDILYEKVLDLDPVRMIKHSFKSRDFEDVGLRIGIFNAH